MKLSKLENSLLIYLEARLVDDAGRVDMQKVNGEEREIIEKWCASGLIQFGRIASEYVTEDGSNWVLFSEEAWIAAHAERCARAARLQEDRNYITTEEKRRGPFLHAALRPTENEAGDA